MEGIQNIRITQIAVSYANDMDFKAIVEMELNILVDQAADLEKRLLYYGVSLPEHFTKVTIRLQTPESIEDEYLYSAVLIGMNSITAIHAITILDIITNDKLRDYFIKLTFDELGYIDKLMKYDKLKGWLPILPKFKTGSVLSIREIPLMYFFIAIDRLFKGKFYYNVEYKYL